MLISGLPEIGNQSRPIRLRPTWVVFRRKCDPLKKKKLECVSDSSKPKRAVVLGDKFLSDVFDFRLTELPGGA
jgi:hypothetical protein